MLETRISVCIIRIIVGVPLLSQGHRINDSSKEKEEDKKKYLLSNLYVLGTSGMLFY
jgi:hypothetical protein